MSSSSRRRAALALAALLAALLYAAGAFSTSGDITNFLPGTGNAEEIELSRAMAHADPGKTMILVIRGRREQVAPATRQLSEALEHHPEIAWVRSGVGEREQRAFYDLFFAARYAFLSSSPAGEIPAMLDEKGLADRAGRLREALAGPLGVLVRRTATADPLLAYVDRLRALQRDQDGRLNDEGGVFMTPDGHGVIFVATVASPFDAKAQRRVHTAITDDFQQIRSALDAELELEMSGLAVLSEHAETTTRRDISRISTVSLTVTVVLFLLFFRSFRAFALLLVPVVFGFVFGLAATLALFGEIHGMTLAFGATLVGVSVDYSVHLIQHHFLSAGRSERSGRGAVRSGILLGSATTLVGFVAMGLTSTPGMQQIAVFGGVGIVVAVVSTFTVVPAFLPALASPPNGLLRMHELLDRWLTGLRHQRRWLYALVAVAIGFSVAMLPRAQWNDDPRALIALDPQLVEADEKVREAVSGADPGRFAVARGDSAESALRANDRLFETLEVARERGQLAGFDSLHRLLWSEELQRRNLELVWGDAELPVRVAAVYQAAGFQAAAFAPFAEHLAGAMPPPISVERMRASPLGVLLHGFLIDTGSSVFVLTRLVDVAQAATLRADIAKLDGAFYFDQGEFIRAAYGGFRERVLAVVLVSLIAVLALVAARYRSASSVAAAFVPAILAAGVTLSVLASFGVTLNLLHVLGLMLVLSIGVDYGVFIVEAERRGADTGVAVLGTLICCVTTVTAFAVLAMSDNPALRALASSVALGALLSFVFAPVGLILTVAKR